jgi:small subunit ribosomal protein S16
VAVRLRLTRVGSRKNPIWRVVATDGRSPRDGRVLEIVGRYNPQPQPSEIVLDRERIDHWLARGAQPSDTVRKLIRAVERGTPPEAATAAPKPAATAVAEPAGDGGDAAASAGAEPDSAEAVASEKTTGSDETASASSDAAPADDGESAGEGEG